MEQWRRRFLARSTAAVLLPWLGSGLVLPGRVLAAEWQRNAFTSRQVAEALKAYGTPTPQEVRDILIQAPEIAENGGKVDVEITVNVPGARSLAVFADRNPFPMCLSLDFAPNVQPYARMQLKLAESTRLRAVVKAADGKAYVAFREIKVTLGGCAA
ncbi:MAG: thiosulfate oxidation carrier protein SoxY [Pseudomonadota bacterium]|jgi:sulfur-oxidizing protein SoxY